MSLTGTAAASTSPSSAASNGMGGIGRGTVAIALLLLVVGAALRIHDLGKLSINGDEIYSVWETRSARKAADSVDVIGAWKTRLSLMVLRNPADPPGIPENEVWRLRFGYRTNLIPLLVDEAAFELFGETPLAVRLGSILFGLAALIVLPWMARPLLGDRGALLLLAFLALCPDVIEMSRFARYMSACFFFGGVAAIAAARFVRDRRPRDEWILLIACALLVLSHLTSLLVAAALFLYVALAARGRISLRILPLAAAVALAAWYFGSYQKVGQVIEEGIVGKARYSSMRLAAALIYNVGPALVGLGIVAGAAILRACASGPDGRREARPFLVWLAAATLPAMVFFWLNRNHDIGPRYFAAIEAPGLLLTAWGAELIYRRPIGRGRRPTGRWLAHSAVALTLLSQAPLLASNWADGQRYPYNEAARLAHERAGPDARIVSDWSGIVEYYLEQECGDPRGVTELPDSLPKLEERLLEGAKPHALLFLPRQRGHIAWPGGAFGHKRLTEWLAAHAQPVTTLGRYRIDSLLNRFGGGYRFELAVFMVDVETLRK